MYKVYHSYVMPPLRFKTYEEVRMYERLQEVVRPGDIVRWCYTDD